MPDFAALRCDAARAVKALAMHPELISTYIAFQDRLEDAFAKGVILPRWLSERFVRERAQSSRISMARYQRGNSTSAARSVFFRDLGAITA